MLRRDVLSGAAALAIGQVLPTQVRAAYGDIPPLKTTVPYPLGVAATDLQIRDSSWGPLATTHFSQLTAEWEMKMEYILQTDGSLKFDRADRLVDFAEINKMSVHGHTLIWYAQDGVYFQKLANKTDAFLNAYVDYITRVMTRYRGKIRGWDVVNEPVLNDGSALRPCLWRQVLGDDYIGLAFEAAHRADPAAVLFLNDYNLEFTPKKRATFLKLVETLLKNGAPIHGIGTQTHIDVSLAPGMIRTALKDIASLGLKVHVSEVDISIRGSRNPNIAELRMKQMRLLDEILSAYNDIPARQRYGLTVWGLRDSDSWLNSKQAGNALLPDEPLLFDRLGRPKP
ncbi:MAG: endo-1,4-beta-xylanase, partial [Asticcacaulis sp.]